MQTRLFHDAVRRKVICSILKSGLAVPPAQKAFQV